MVAQSFRLVMRKGPTPGKVFALSNDQVTMGRDTTNDIVINDVEISRNHARFTKQGDGYLLEDLGSTNGTFVNEQRLSGSYVLKAGQSVRFGENVTLSYELAGFDPDATLASGQGKAPAAAAAAPAAPPARPARQAQPAYSGQVPPGPASQPKRSGLLGNRNLLIGCGGLLVIGACIAIASLWYIDANVLWCDVFGSLIPGC
jgi:predicted component of type VI protein secretion system